MIYTITFNPAADLVIVAKKLETNTVNRTKNLELQLNDKGVNISFILKKMGIKNMVAGIGSGFILDYIAAGLEEKGIKTKFLRMREPTRINVFTRILGWNTEYKEVSSSPEVGPEVQDKFLKHLKNTLKADDTLIISGSFLKGIEAECLVEIAKVTAEKDIKLVTDSSSRIMLDALQYQPYLLKPNDQKLANFFDLNEKLDQGETIELIRKLISADCQNVLVSLGENGATLINKDHAHFDDTPKIQAFNTAGAGDTMLGTFIGEESKAKSDTTALKSAVTAVSDAASRSGLADLKLGKCLKETQADEIK